MNMKWSEALKHLGGAVNPNNQCPSAIRLIIANNTKDEEVLWSMRNDSNARVANAVIRKIADHDHMLEMVRTNLDHYIYPLIRRLSDDDIRMLAAEDHIYPGIRHSVAEEAIKRNMQDIVRSEIENTIQDIISSETKNHYVDEYVLSLLDRIDNPGEYLWSMRDKVASLPASSAKLASRLIAETTSIERLESLYYTYKEPLITEIAERIEILKYEEDAV